MRKAPFLAALALMVACGAASAAVTLDVVYGFEPGSRATSRVSASITSVEMGSDVPLAVTGEAGVDLALEVVSVEDGVATLRAEFGEVQATLLGEAQEPTTPAPLQIQVDERGALTDVNTGGAEIDLFASGGVPLQFVVLLAGVVQLPPGPLGLGESWTAERCQQLPNVGEIALSVTSRIVEISAGELTVLTDLQASLPDFTTANPMQAGEITIKNGVLSIEGMRRTIDAGTGLIKSVDATMLFDGFAAFGPIAPLPLSVTSSFAIERTAAPAQAERSVEPGEDG